MKTLLSVCACAFDGSCSPQGMISGVVSVTSDTGDGLLTFFHEPTHNAQIIAMSL